MNSSAGLCCVVAGLGLAAGLVLAPGCTVARAMATMDPGLVPRAGELVEAVGVGAEQVRVVFRFKVGPDPAGGEPGGPGEPAEAHPGGVGARVAAARFNDARGQSFSVVEQEVRPEGNAFSVVLTSSAVSRETYEVVCQARVIAGGYQVNLAGSACREAEGWRIEPRSFRFAVYGADQAVPWWDRTLVPFE